MTKSKKRPTPKAAPTKISKALPAQSTRAATAPKTTGQPEELVVFAFRLTLKERDLIHRAAGPANASRFIRSLAVAAAERDESAIRALLAKPATS